MKLLVDEVPLYKDDCMFAELRWGKDEEMWITHCKFSGEKCDLVWDEHECSFLKEQDK